jgi:formamidopyrimidine-DNA glycosylase
MPELPEVETIRRTLEPLISGRRIAGLSIRDFPGVIGDLAPEMAGALISGRRVVEIERRGKYLIILLDDGTGIEIHLRMTGQVEVLPRGAPPQRFEHLAIHFLDGDDLRYSDQRKFGRVLIRVSDPVSYLRDKLGPEPLTRQFTASRLAAALAGRRLPIKSALLNQRIVAGIGNIYADEALFHARLHPLRPSGGLSSDEIVVLRNEIRRVLRAAIERRGTTFSSYRDATGREGENQERLAVYGRGRSGEPCSRCGHALSFLVIGGRTSHYCPSCQPPGDSLS